MINKFKERRVEEIATPTIVVEGRYAAEDERATEHNYSNPPELYEVLVPIEPQPVFDTDNEIWNWENDELKLNFFPSDTLTLAKHSPLKPGDVIKEEWCKQETLDKKKAWPEIWEIQYHWDFEKLPASTMPSSLNHLCHKVLAVLGVEEREEILVSGEGCEYMGDEKWHFKYLTTGEK